MGIFDGKVAIITGGGKAKSIGYGMATAYAKEGANLVITGRNEQKLLDAKEELERLYGIKVLACQADVTAGRRVGGPWSRKQCRRSSTPSAASTC